MRKRTRRGRPPIHRKAMTAAERQARRRQRLKEIARQRQQEQMERRAYQPPRGYGRAKEQMIKEGHQFERARREFGFEEGVFVDGAFLGTSEVIDLATLPLQQRQQRIAEHRRARRISPATQ